MLGRLQLQVEKRETDTVPEDPNITQFRTLVPNVFRIPEIFLPFDPVLETMQQEQRTAALWKRFCPEVYEARERLDVAERVHAAAFAAYQERQRQVAVAQNNATRSNPDMPGDKEGRSAEVATAKVFAEIAQFNLELAQKELGEARAQLAEAVKR
jgi:hypothetical protein